MAYDKATGQKIQDWGPGKLPTSEWGNMLVDGNKVYIVSRFPNDVPLLALDKGTGELLATDTGMRGYGMSLLKVGSHVLFGGQIINSPYIQPVAFVDQLTFRLSSFFGASFPLPSLPSSVNMAFPWAMTRVGNVLFVGGVFKTYNARNLTAINLIRDTIQRALELGR